MRTKRIALFLPKPFQWVLFGAFATSWFTGLAFFILRDFFVIEGDFGPENHAWQYPALTVHGLAAFLMMILFGAMVAAHLPMGWRTKRSRFWGITLMSAVSLQIITAYLLYYIAGDASREIVGLIHLIIGILLPIVLYTHIKAGIKGRP